MDESVPARTCVDRKPQRKWSDREEKSSPTVVATSILLTSMIEAKEGRDVSKTDVPKAFIQTDQLMGEDGERVVTKVTGPLVDTSVDMSPSA